MTQIKLSILIPTVVGREESFDSLMKMLNTQKDALGVDSDQVEICTLKDDKAISIGAKRQKLLEMAQGEYVVFIDDDDSVVGNYMRKVLIFLDKFSPDIIYFYIDYFINGEFSETLTGISRIQSLDSSSSHRPCMHLFPVKRVFALSIGFEDVRHGEDSIYSKGLSKLIKAQGDIPSVMYFYNYSDKENPFQKYGITPDTTMEEIYGK